MTVKTALSFTDRHDRIPSEKFRDRQFAARSAAVANAIKRTMQDEEEREVALSALTGEVRARPRTARSEYVDPAAALSAVRAAVEATRGK